MTGHPSLNDARLKIEWTKGYLRDLHSAIAAFLESKPYSVITDNNPETGEISAKLRLAKSVSPEVQRLAGNFVTDIRSVLDYMVCELSILTDGDPARGGVEFPIAKDREEFEKSSTQRKIRRLPSEAQDVIRKIQPYKGGDGAPLWALNELRRKSIHHSIVTMGHATTGFGPGVLKAGPEGRVALMAPVWHTADDEPTILTAKGAGSEYQITIAVDICLKDIEGFERTPLAPFLEQCGQAIEGIVRHFDLTFFPKT